MIDLFFILAYFACLFFVDRNKRREVALIGIGFCACSLIASLMISSATHKWVDHLIISIVTLSWAYLIYNKSDNRDAVILVSAFSIFQAIASFDSYVLPFTETFISYYHVHVASLFNFLIIIAAIGNGNTISASDKRINRAGFKPHTESN